MLKVLMTCFLSFVVSGGTVVPYGEISTYGFGYDISKISYAEQEIEWSYVGFVGRHDMIKIEECRGLGEQSIHRVTGWYDGTGLTNFKFVETFSTVNTTTVSTTEQLSSKVSTGLQMQVGIPGMTIKTDAKNELVYTISNTATYTVTESKSLEVYYEARDEYINGKVFALGMVADVYEIVWKSWQWDDWWWGDYVVDGSEETHISYLTVDPRTTIIYQDGSFVS